MSNKAKNIDKNHQILDAAAKHFAVNGFEGARVDEIAAEAGVNKATLYYRIGDKAAIYDHIFINMLDNVLEKINKNVSSVQSAEEKLKKYSLSIAEAFNSNAHISPFILREVASGGTHMSPDALEKMKKVRLALSKILTSGVESGEFKAISPFLIYIMMIGTLNFFSTSYSIRDRLSDTTLKEDNISITEVAKTISDLVLNSIRINSNST